MGSSEVSLFHFFWEKRDGKWLHTGVRTEVEENKRERENRKKGKVFMSLSVNRDISYYTAYDHVGITNSLHFVHVVMFNLGVKEFVECIQHDHDLVTKRGEGKNTWQPYREKRREEKDFLLSNLPTSLSIFSPKCIEKRKSVENYPSLVVL